MLLDSRGRGYNTVEETHRRQKSQCRTAVLLKQLNSAPNGRTPRSMRMHVTFLRLENLELGKFLFFYLFCFTFQCLPHSKQLHQPNPSLEKDAIHNHRVRPDVLHLISTMAAPGSVGLKCLSASRLLANCKIAVQLHDKLPLYRLQPRSRIAIPLQTQPGKSTAQLIS